MKLLLLALFALPLAAEPLFDLYDCTGRESACTGLFPGSAADPDGGSWSWRESPYTIGGRVVVNGIDLGPARVPVINPPFLTATFTAFFYRDPWVIGWEYCCDMDDDGILVKWKLGNGVAVRTDHGEVSGFSPSRTIVDVNASGQFIARLPGDWPYHEDLSFNTIEDGETWRERLVSLDDHTAAFLRINDNGQILGSAEFWNPINPNGPTDPLSSPRMILISPVDVPFGTPPSGTPSPTPEPGTWLLLGFGLLACACAKRWRSVI